MAKGRLSQESNNRQERIENVLSGLGVSLALLQHDSLRVMQMIRRSGGANDLSDGVLEDLARVRNEIRRAQDVLREEWEHGQNSGWKE